MKSRELDTQICRPAPSRSDGLGQTAKSLNLSQFYNDFSHITSAKSKNKWFLAIKLKKISVKFNFQMSEKDV